ncbi:YggT family protein [Clostridium vincentii]|uniref:YGGT family protein n=1 Tax=Clostridium vincentii TaxID=52704 RepID=A0A2T0BGF4_9CLOT|nr:YggT family protein [Clostridium vincentii]PRR82934.1 YGGT family protein [Clostridium vincentii]
MNLIQNLIVNLLRVLETIVLIQCLLSWFIRDGRNEIMNGLKTITNPILEPFRRIQERFFGNMNIDLSPLLAILVLQFIRRTVVMMF